MSEGIKNKVVQTFKDSISVKQQIVDKGSYEVLTEAGDIISESISKGGKLLLCGNGGSAADAQHLAAEFLICLLYTSPSPRDQRGSRMPSSA